MRKSDFLQRLNNAVLAFLREYNSPDVDKRAFDWPLEITKHAQAAGLPVQHEADDPILVAARFIVRDRGASLSFETLVQIEKAWECFQARMSGGVRDRV